MAPTNSIASASIDFLSTYPIRDDEPIISCLISSNQKNPYIVAFTEDLLFWLWKRVGAGEFISCSSLSEFPLSLLFFIYFYNKKLSTISQKQAAHSHQSLAT